MRILQNSSDSKYYFKYKTDPLDLILDKEAYQKPQQPYHLTMIENIQDDIRRALANGVNIKDDLRLRYL
jgi:hypothetical protein